MQANVSDDAQILSPLGCLIYTGCTGNIYRFIYLHRVLLISLKFPIEMRARESCVFRKYCTRVNLNSYTDMYLAVWFDYHNDRVQKISESGAIFSLHPVQLQNYPCN